MRTAVYVDGFNLYYWLKRSPYRWVDLKALVLSALSKSAGKQHEIVAVKYFTARVSDTPDDPGKSTRQDIYFRALKAAIPELTIYSGEFRRQERQVHLVSKGKGTGSLVWVWDTEEKGSDVNLAVELVNDAWTNLYDLAIVVSNDSDLERALRIVKKKRLVGVLVRGDAEVISLRKVSNFCKTLTEEDLKAALLPRTIPNTNIRIPHLWELKEDAARLREAIKSP